MTYEMIRETIATITGIPKDEIMPESHLYNELDVDSLDMAQITLALENHFKIDLSDEVVAGVKTVRNLIDAVDAELGD